MNYYTELFLVPGNSRGAVVFDGCSNQFMQKAKKLLKTLKGKIPAACVSFSNKDEKIIQQFVSAIADGDKLKEFIIARTYVDTKIFSELFKVVADENFKNLESAQKLKQQVERGVEIFNNGKVEEFAEYYCETPLYEQVFQNLVNGTRSWELNIFINQVNNIALQIAINNHIDHRKNYNVKVFSNLDRFCTYRTHGGYVLENVHDYSSQKPFEIEDGCSV